MIACYMCIPSLKYFCARPLPLKNSADVHVLLQVPLYKQLRHPGRHGDVKNIHGETLLHYAIQLKQYDLAVRLLNAGVSVTATNTAGETAWKLFVRSWGTPRHGVGFYSVLTAFIARLGASYDINCDACSETALHLYGKQLELLRARGGTAYPQLPMTGVVEDSVHCLFLLLNVGCRVNAQQEHFVGRPAEARKILVLPFQTTVFQNRNFSVAGPFLDEMLIMLTAAGSRLQLCLKETERLAIIVGDFAKQKSVADLLSLHALGLLTAHSDEARERLRSSDRVTSSVSDDIIDQVCSPRRLKDLCLSCVRMNCYPNAFVAASKLPLPTILQEGVPRNTKTDLDGIRRS